MSAAHIPQVDDLFVCARCGSCCQGETTVSLTENDQRRMADFLGLSKKEAAERYWRLSGSPGAPVVQMRVEDGHCVFFDPDRGCAVHEARPWRCRQWPLHPSILADEANFSAISASCPGLNREPGYEGFCRIFRTLIANGAVRAKSR